MEFRFRSETRDEVALLLLRDATVTVCHSKTAGLRQLVRSGYIVVAAEERRSGCGVPDRPAGFVLDKTVLVSALEHRVAEVKALLRAAEKEAREAEARLARVKGDYAGGGLPLSDWLEFKAELEPQREAAQAEVERLRSQLVEVEAGEALSDVEQEVLEQLAQIRAAVAGAVEDAGAVEGVHSVLLRLFDGFVLHRGLPDQAHVELIGDCWIEPIVSQQGRLRREDATRACPQTA